MTQSTDPTVTPAPESPGGPSELAPSGGAHPTGETSPRGAKVELDIDDAPFLEEPEEEKPQEKPAEAPKPVPAPTPKAAEAVPLTGLAALLGDKKKLALLGGGLAFVLIVLPLLLMLLLREGPPPPVVHEPERIVVSGVPPREDAPPGPRFLYRLGGFFIEQRGSEGELRFVRASFAIPTDNSALFAELSVKDVVVRDAIYYYLRNKPLSFLAEQASRDLLRSELISVINEHIASEKVQELFFEEYLVTGG